ncbi:MAG: hypothetical protein HC804_01355 [Anaerolineae bacterium]|nr:hypothetical protein [Anaerolineae bacterium]
MQATMSDPFGYSLDQSEWQSLTSVQMIAQLDQELIPEGARIQFSPPNTDIATMLGGQDPAALMGPDVNVVDVLHSTHWGEDGQGEAILFIIQREDEQFRWHATIYAPAGFPRPIVDETVTATAVAATPLPDNAIKEVPLSPVVMPAPQAVFSVFGQGVWRVDENGISQQLSASDDVLVSPDQTHWFMRSGQYVGQRVGNPVCASTDHRRGFCRDLYVALAR